MEAVVDRHRDVFPGDAGNELAWAILCGAPPPLYRLGPSSTMRHLFEEDVPPYASPFSRAGKNRYAARSSDHATDVRRKQPKAENVLRLLRENRSHAEIADRLKLKSIQLHQTLHRLRARRGLRLRTNADQELLAGISEHRFSPRRAGLKDSAMVEVCTNGENPQELTLDPSLFRTNKPTQHVAAEQVEAITGYQPDELRAAGAKTFIRRHLADPDSAQEIFEVPLPLLREPLK